MKKQFYIVTALFLLILSGAFYWFEYRPTKIRKNCFNTSLGFSKDYQDTFYKNCVMGNGVKP